MSAAEVLENDQKKPTLRLLRGGKGPPSDNTPGEDWLSKLPAGSVFAFRKKGQAENFVLGLFQVVYKHGRTVVLSDSLNSNPYGAVDPIEFSKRHEFFELIQEGGALEEGGQLPEGDNNDDAVRAIRSSGVADDADAEGRQPEHDPS